MKWGSSRRFHQSSSSTGVSSSEVVAKQRTMAVSAQTMEEVSTTAAIHRGLAGDGGLWVPIAWPQVPINEWSKHSLAQLGGELLKLFFKGEDLESEIPDLAFRAFNFPVPLRRVNERTQVLELFHGPTCAFKDFGARFLALALSRSDFPLPPRVLVATSGDTGGAVASAFCEFTKIPVTILFPKGRISARQQQQLCCWGDQVQSIAVEGSFDDCQSLVKASFADADLKKRWHLLSANSINLGRLLPQMVAIAWCSLQSPPSAGLVVPSGNLGHATAALWAKALGFPIQRVVLAHNANRSVVDAFKKGSYLPQTTVTTLANAMDVGAPSNIERLLALGDFNHLKSFVSAESVSDLEIRHCIEKIWRDHRYVVCPHTAVGMVARERLGAGDWIVLGTAHPAKFDTIVEPLIGEPVPVPPELASLLAKPARFQELPSDFKKFKESLLKLPLKV